jgi:hypothetical protein
VQSVARRRREVIVVIVIVLDCAFGVNDVGRFVSRHCGLVVGGLLQVGS